MQNDTRVRDLNRATDRSAVSSKPRCRAPVRVLYCQRDVHTLSGFGRYRVLNKHVVVVVVVGARFVCTVRLKSSRVSNFCVVNINSAIASTKSNDYAYTILARFEYRVIFLLRTRACVHATLYELANAERRNAIKCCDPGDLARQRFRSEQSR